MPWDWQQMGQAVEEFVLGEGTQGSRMGLEQLQGWADGTEVTAGIEVTGGSAVFAPLILGLHPC